VKVGEQQTAAVTFDEECEALGRSYAAARLRSDLKAPAGFKSAFEAYRGPRKAVDDYFERKWLSLRLSALKRGMVVDPTVTPDFLRRVVPGSCPVTLEPFEMEGKSTRNPSIDRLVNEVTYLAGNICALSLRANRAKGEKSFDEVAAIAQAGGHRDGLAPVEWMRLASLMYGAWAKAFKFDDPYLLPLAAIPGPGTFMSTSQVVQLLLTRHLGPGAQRLEEAANWWLSLTRAGGAREQLFVELRAALAEALLDEAAQPGNAWLHPGVFDAFVAWYSKARGALIPAIEDMLQQLQDRRADPVASLYWPATGRYRH
jgi:hypothetical protein